MSAEVLNEMRIALVHQIDELCDQIERTAWRLDPDEQRLAHGAIDHAKEVAKPHRYNGPLRVVPIHDLLTLLPGPYYMDLPDGGDTTVLEQLQRMAEDAARYRWLRTPPNNLSPAIYGPTGGLLRRDTYLDAAIDAARAAQAQGTA